MVSSIPLLTFAQIVGKNLTQERIDFDNAAKKTIAPLGEIEIPFAQTAAKT